MSDIESAKAIEVWLTKNNIEITCSVVFEDESTDTLSVDSLSMRGAQREITGWLKARGFEPAGRWVDEEGGAGGTQPDESSRTFRKARQEAAA